MITSQLYPRFLKRWFDWLGAMLVLLVLFPLLALIYVLNYFLANGQPVFTQQRAGKDGKIFSMYKFTTMRPSDKPVWDPAEDIIRLTRFGRFLRNYSLDELPQLFNILLGQMSFIGPRPLPTEYLGHYSNEQNRRHEVYPGITGWAQVNGRNQITWTQRLEMDVWYVENISLRIDVIILFKTSINLLTRRGINKSEILTMEKFYGTKN